MPLYISAKYSRTATVRPLVTGNNHCISGEVEGSQRSVWNSADGADAGSDGSPMMIGPPQAPLSLSANVGSPPAIRYGEGAPVVSADQSGLLPSAAATAGP